MTKYKTTTRSYDDLKPGDLVAVSFGFLAFRSGKLLASGNYEMTLSAAHGEPYQITQHASNWPEVAIGFTDEYQAAYPGERFSGTVFATTENIPTGVPRYAAMSDSSKVPHLLVDLPEGNSTVVIRTSNGALITLGFSVYDGPPHARCVDIIHHTNGTTARNGSRDVPTFPVAVRSGPTGNVLYSSDPTLLPPGKVPATCVILGIPEHPRR